MRRRRSPVESIRRWREAAGAGAYPGARQLLIRIWMSGSGGRLWGAGAGAGPGGISRMAALTRSHPDTVRGGARELEQGIELDGRVSQAGAGRPPATDLDPGLVDALRKLVEPETRGDPVHPLLWTTK